jgi:hypothetical protein
VSNQPSHRSRSLLRFACHVALLLFTATAIAAAAELDGVIMPGRQDAAGYPFVLAGLHNKLVSAEEAATLV